MSHQQAATRSESVNAALIGGVLCAMLAGSAFAAWPTDPASPLVVGSAEGTFGPRQSMLVSDDGAVWVSWQDSFCVGSVRAQRIAPDGTLLSVDGIETQDDPTCGFLLPPMMVTSGDSIVLGRAQSPTQEFPLQSLLPDGSPRWTPGYIAGDISYLQAGSSLGNGEIVLASWGNNFHLRVDRLDAAGDSVWGGETLLPSITGSNYRVIAAVPDELGGAIVFWDAPTAYRRVAYVNRVDEDGSIAWSSSVRIFGTDLFNEGSRHTPPVAVRDGAGGAVFVWTHGQESGSTPVPIKMQRVNNDGSLSFPFEGVRVSTSADRQFDADVERDEATGDLLITWRNGFLAETSVRAQRMTLTGERLWGDEGVEITPLNDMNDAFDAVWNNGTLAVAIADDNGVRVHRVDGSGTPIDETWTAASSGPAESVVMKAADDALVISWQHNGPGNDDPILAQRINPNGLLGGPMCNAADFTGDGSLDVFDVFAFLDAFNNAQQPADFVPDGLFDIFDVFAYLDAFNAGCP
ncbi:MAG: hypothetical protein KC996_01055 [Phycisphaerales bacterium]|nr:hypothetical protein [Phycisphaerales bacterium]